MDGRPATLTRPSAPNGLQTRCLPAHRAAKPPPRSTIATDCRPTTSATRCSAARPLRGARRDGLRRSRIVTRSTCSRRSWLVAPLAPTRAFRCAGVAAGQLGSWTSAQTASFASVLLLSTRGLERRGRELLASYVAAGGGMLIAVGQDVDGDVVGDVLGAASKLRVQAPDDDRRRSRVAGAGRRPSSDVPAVRTGSGDARPGDGSSVSRHQRPRVARRSRDSRTGEAALIECGTARVMRWCSPRTSNNRWNDFPLHATFVPVHARDGAVSVASARAQATEYLVGEAPAGAVPVPGIVTLGAAGRRRAGS